MSAFFFALNRNGEPFSQPLAEKMHAQLDRFGADGSTLLVRRHFAMGYHRLWTVPEEIGESQPVQDKQAGLWLLFHGRVDNRADLLSRVARERLNLLGLKEITDVSDAQLLLMLYLQFGESILEQIIGPFVLAIFSEQTGKLLAARDAMGGRYLVYRVTEKHILLATYEMALAAHPSVPYEVRRLKAGRLLANMMDAQPESLLEGLTPLEPGSMVLCSSKQSPKVESFNLPNPRTRIELDSLEDYAEAFKRLLMQAVARRMRSIKPVGVMLSGGLDSVPMAICGAQQSSTLDAFSWVFDHSPEADERHYSQPVCEKFGIKAHWINCDQVWPQFDHTMHCNPVVPFSTPYSAYTQALFARAQETGTGVVLSGMGGDMLYSGIETLLLELVKSGRWREAILESGTLVSAMPSAKSFVKKFVINPMLRRHSIQSAPSWLKARSPDLHLRETYLWESIKASRRPQQYFNVVGSLEGEDAAYGRYLESTYQLERRYPYRDRDLVDFMLAIPTDQLFYQGISRPIVRRAFQDEMPKVVVERQGKTNFSSVIDAGIQRDKNFQHWLSINKPQWTYFVDESYIWQKNAVDSGNLGLKWRCAYYEYWKTVCYTSHAQKLG